jgi:single-strand DNA-binding protein
MASLNKIMIIGNVGKDPEVKTTNSGKTVCNFSVATSHGSGDNASTEWHRVTCWDKTAELVGKYVTKGKQVYVEGRLQTRSYEKDGVTRYSTEVIANQVTFLGGKGDSTPSGSDSPSKHYEEPAEEDDNVPF